MFVFIFAGSDTTASSLAFTLYLLHLVSAGTRYSMLQKFCDLGNDLDVDGSKRAKRWQ